MAMSAFRVRFAAPNGGRAVARSWGSSSLTLLSKAISGSARLGAQSLANCAKISTLSLRSRWRCPRFTSPRWGTRRNRWLARSCCPDAVPALWFGADRVAITTKPSQGNEQPEQRRSILWRITSASIDTVIQPGIILFRHMGNAVTDTSGVPRLTVVWSVG